MFLASLVPNILVVTPSVRVKTMADIIALAKKTPGGLDFASSGNGTLQHLCLEMFRHVIGAKINHIPYRGGGLALNDVMAGQVKFFFSNGSSSVGLVQGGKVKAIAHTGKGRLGTLPDLPAVSGHPAGLRGLRMERRVRRRPARRRRSSRSSTPASTRCCGSPTVIARLKSLNVDLHGRTRRRNSAPSSKAR